MLQAVEKTLITLKMNLLFHFIAMRNASCYNEQLIEDITRKLQPRVVFQLCPTGAAKDSAQVDPQK